ncbi:MAG: hypothetical protein JRJ12_01655 [Deltaproteobacteria bacterium]|nr:hypothetical protein [Deltaproteobacteria bacterium]MBW2069927.1 hypothetical protein [Deltaproteobacteria bacterium]
MNARQNTGSSMGSGSIFLMRVGLGILFAYLVVKLFYPGGGVVAVGFFALFFVGLAYLMAHLRQKRAEEERFRK